MLLFPKEDINSSDHLFFNYQIIKKVFFFLNKDEIY